MWYFKKSVILIIQSKVIHVNMLAFQKMVPWYSRSLWLKIRDRCARESVMVAGTHTGKDWIPVCALVQPESFRQYCRMRRNVSPNSSSYWACVLLCLNFIFCSFLLVYSKFLIRYCELFFWAVNSVNFIITHTRKHIVNITFLNSVFLLVLFLRSV